MALTLSEQQKLLALSKEQIADKRRLKELNEEELEFLREKGKLAKETIQALQESYAEAAKLLKVYEAQAKTLKDKSIVRIQALETERRFQKVQGELLKIGQLTLKEYTKEIKASERRISLNEQMLEIQGKFLVSQKESVKAANQLGTSLASTTSAFQGVDLAGIFGNITKAIQGGTASLVSFGAAASFGIIGNMINDFVNLLIAAANLELGLEKLTGGKTRFAQGARRAYTELNEFGVTMEEVDASASSLYTGMSQFSLMLPAMQDELIKATSALVNYGVSADHLTAGLQIQQKMFGMTGASLAQANAEIFSFAVDIGEAPAKMAADFAAAGADLAKFGDQGMQTFKELARLSKLTGMEIGKLKQMTDIADTFEGAATTAGRLNAAIGGNFVNAMDLMMATDPAERFNIMTGAIEDAGLSFQNMSYYQRIYYAEAMGLSDVSELALVLSGRQDLLTGSTHQTAESYQKLAEDSLAVQSIQEQWNAALAQNADEIIEMIGGMDLWIEKLKGLPEYFDGLITTMRNFAIGAALVFLALLKAGFGMMATGAAAATAFVEMAPLLTSTATLVSEMAVLGTELPVVAGELGVVGAAAGTSAGGATAAATAIGVLITGLNTLTAELPVFVAALEGLGTAFASFGAKATAATPALTALNGVIWPLVLVAAILGATIVAVVWGTVELVRSFKDLGDAAWPAAIAVGALGLSIYGMVVALGSFTATPAGWAALALLGLIAIIVQGMASMMAAATIGVNSLGVAIGQLANLDTDTISDLKTVASELSNVGALPQNNVFSALEGLARISLQSTIEDVQQLAAAINSTTTAEAQAFTTSLNTAQSALITSAANPGAGASAPGRGRDDQPMTLEVEIPITINLDSAQTTNLIKEGATETWAEHIEELCCAR